MTKETKIDKVAMAIRNWEGTVTIEGNTIILPSSQLCGTETQRITYSRLKARELVEGLEE